MRYAFDNFELDTSTLELRANNETVALEPQVFALLQFLIEHRDRVVSRDEIIETVWGGRFVSDAAVSSRIKSARQALGDSGATQRFIKTVHRRGFRFVADVAIGGGATDSSNAMATRDDQLANDGEDLVFDLDMSLPEKPSVLVLPFLLLGDERHRIVADGLTLDITTRLARLRWLFVIARGTAFRFRDTTSDPASIASRLGVRYVLSGSAQVSGERMRVHVVLIDTVSNREIWVDEFDRQLKDVLSLQEEIAALAASAIEREIERVEQARAMMYADDDLDAWSAYHRGCHHMYKSTREDLDHAEGMLRRSLRLDPKAPRPYAALSFVNWQRAFLEIEGGVDRTKHGAIENAQRCIDLDPLDPLGHWALGRAHLLFQRNDEGIMELSQSVRLNPSFALGHYSLALALGLTGRFLDSQPSVAEARRLSPYDPMTYAMLAQQAVNTLLVGKPEEAAQLADRAAQQPNAHVHVRFIGAYCNAIAGRMDIARHHAAAVLAQRPDYRSRDYWRALPMNSDKLRAMIGGVLRSLEIPE